MAPLLTIRKGEKNEKCVWQGGHGLAVRAAQRGLQALEVEESSNAESLAQHEAVDQRCARHIPSNKSRAAVLAVGMLPIKIKSLTTENLPIISCMP